MSLIWTKSPACAAIGVCSATVAPICTPLCSVKTVVWGDDAAVHGWLNHAIVSMQCLQAALCGL